MQQGHEQRLPEGPGARPASRGGQGPRPLSIRFNTDVGRGESLLDYAARISGWKKEADPGTGLFRG